MPPVADSPIEEVWEVLVPGVIHEGALHHVHDVTLIRLSLALVRNLGVRVEAERVEDDGVKVVDVA